RRLAPAEGRRADDFADVAMREPLKEAPLASIVRRREDVFERGQRELAPNDVADVLFRRVRLETIAVVASERDEERSHEPVANRALHVLPRPPQCVSVTVTCLSSWASARSRSLHDFP